MHGTPRCSARSRSGAACRNAPVTGRTRCRMHGGASPRGAASASFKHGRYSRDLPSRLAARYSEAKHDPERLRLHDEIALASSRAGELVARLDKGGGAEAWESVSAALAAYRAASSSGDGARTATALSALEQAVEAGCGEAGIWRELWDVLDRGARFKAAERRLAVAEASAIQVDEALALVAALVAIVRSHVTDRETLTAISRDTEKLLHGGEN